MSSFALLRQTLYNSSCVPTKPIFLPLVPGRLLILRSFTVGRLTHTRGSDVTVIREQFDRVCAVFFDDLCYCDKITRFHSGLISLVRKIAGLRMGDGDEGSKEKQRQVFFQYWHPPLNKTNYPHYNLFSHAAYTAFPYFSVHIINCVSIQTCVRHVDIK